MLVYEIEEIGILNNVLFMRIDIDMCLKKVFFYK